MEKKLIVIVDTDEEYVSALEYKLIEEWQDHARLHIITQLKYYNEFFSQPRTIDVLIINEFLYSDKIKKQNCDYTFILKEDETTAQEYDGSVVELSKYSSIKEIYTAISRTVRMEPTQSITADTKLYMVYAPAGGCGKTLCALGLCEMLSELGKRVLYVNAENLQTFHAYLKDDVYAKPSLGYAMTEANFDIYREVLTEIGNENFDFLRPLEKSPIAYHIKIEDFSRLIQKLSVAKLYDCIVIEVSTEMTYEKIQWMDQMDKLFIITGQDQLSVDKLDCFLKNIAYSGEKYMIVCNRLNKNKENVLGPFAASLGLSVCEYIEEKEGGWMTLEDIRQKSILKTTAYMLD